MSRTVWLPIAAAFVSFIVIWQVVVTVTALPPYILPPPGTVAERFVGAWLDGTIWPHFATVPGGGRIYGGRAVTVTTTCQITMNETKAAAIGSQTSIVAETVAANAGIGHLMLVASSRLEVPLAFAGLIVTGLMGVGMYVICVAIERRMTGWATRGSEGVTFGN